MNDEQKHLDATKPGNVPVSHTSKPAIITHQPLPHDPMMREPAKPRDDFEVKPHKEIELQLLQPNQENKTQAKSPITADNDAELPKSVIENKPPIVDQGSVQINDLIEKKTYKLPIQPSSTKTIIRVVTVLIALIVLVAIGIIVFVMN